jgi:succinate dehydrogenase/fumarate reductase flavoprotein subunit
MSTLQSIERWSDEADVLILGFGLSGAVAAIEASTTDAEADVLIVEKNPEHKAGGSSRASSQGLCLVADDVEGLMTYQRALNDPNPVPEPTLRAWAEGMVELYPWVTQMAKEVGMAVEVNPRDPEYAEFPGSSAVVDGFTVVPRPSGVWNCFKAHVDRHPIRTRFGVRAVDLIQDPDTLEVFGAIVEQGSERLAIRARRGVVMCVGGFSGSREMNLNYNGQDLYTLGNPANTGDGLRMLQRAGADLWHLRNRNQTGGAWAAMKFPEFDAAFFRKPSMDAWSWIDIARDNRRFCDEGATLFKTHNRVKVHGQWVDAPYAFVLPIHMIFDESTRTGGGLAVDGQSWNAIVEGYKWSPDNSTEIARGWIHKADSIRELARIIGRKPDEVEVAVARYNEFARAGHDADFGRIAERMQPIDKPPFYAVEVVAASLASTGGAKRDGGAHVLGHDGIPIPRLYEAGELGSTLANLYQNGELLTECMVFGRIAGRNAVGEPAWAEVSASK